MSHVPLGKVLLRNVIRHTGAHNKIQEESEMWKIREMEKQSKDIYWGKQPRMLPKSSRWQYRCGPHLLWRRTFPSPLLQCHYSVMTYSALLPFCFMFYSNGERNEQNSVNGKRKRHLGQQSSLDLPPRKKPKKSHKKKQKKKSHKKQKKKKRRREQPSTTPESSSESGPSEGEGGAQKRGRHKRTKKASAQAPGSFSGQAENDSGKASSSSSNPSSSSEDSGMEEKQKQRKKKKRRKHHSSVSERGRERVQEKRSKRKNWKVAADENSEDSSDED
nr:uncharacterized protein NKAPD1-like [Anolis sagrei ordinatus]